MYYLINSQVAIHTKMLRDLRLTTSALMKNIKINIAKLNVYKKYFKKFLKNLLKLKSLLKIKLKTFVVMKIYQWKRSTYFLYERLQQFLKLI